MLLQVLQARVAESIRKVAGTVCLLQEEELAMTERRPKLNHWFIKFGLYLAPWKESYVLDFAIIKLLEYPKEGYMYISAKHKGFWINKEFRTKFGFNMNLNLPNIADLKEKMMKRWN